MPMKGNGTNPGSTVPSIVAHFNMHLEIFLLQVTEKFIVSCHVKGSTTIQIPHKSKCTGHHARDQWEFKLKLWGKGLTNYWSSSLLVLLLLWTVSIKMPMLVTVKTLHLGHVLLLAILGIRFRKEFLSLPLPHLGSQSTILFILILRWRSISGVPSKLLLHQIWP